MSTTAENDVAMIEKLRAAHQRLKKEIGKVIIGQDQVLDQLLMAIFCRSHALLMGVPGPPRPSWSPPWRRRST
jgi:MoxR-like ATPase